MVIERGFHRTLLLLRLWFLENFIVMVMINLSTRLFKLLFEPLHALLFLLLVVFLLSWAGLLGEIVY